MKKHNVSTLEQLSEKANDDLEWFWKEVERYIGIIWDNHTKRSWIFLKDYHGQAGL